ncbi:hypothetical protein CBS101457_000092 [Exobasidium rhododendri]|nr:hypothetical protein CBS101457_000092 [Exobasidium rhododendri]
MDNQWLNLNLGRINTGTDSSAQRPSRSGARTSRPESRYTHGHDGSHTSRAGPQLLPLFDDGSNEYHDTAQSSGHADIADSQFHGSNERPPRRSARTRNELREMNFLGEQQQQLHQQDQPGILNQAIGELQRFSQERDSFQYGGTQFGEASGHALAIHRDPSVYGGFPHSFQQHQHDPGTEQLNAHYAQNMNLGSSSQHPGDDTNRPFSYQVSQYHPGLEDYSERMARLLQHQEYQTYTGQEEEDPEYMEHMARQDRQHHKTRRPRRGADLPALRETRYEYPLNPDKDFNDRLVEGTFPAAYEYLIVAAPPSLYRPAEYTLRLHSQFHYTADNEKVYFQLSENQRLYIMDQIRQIRPLKSEAIRKGLANRLKASTALKFMTGEIEQIEEATQELYHIDAQRMNATQPHWMTGMTNAQRRQVIDELAEATSQPSDSLRELFLYLGVSVQVAQSLLNADDEERLQIAEERQLYAPVDPRALPWRTGLSKMQRTALIQRLLGPNVGTHYARELLQDPRNPVKFGLYLLRASDAQFQVEKSQLRGTRRNLG